MPGLIRKTCLKCGKAYHVLKNSHVWCPNCHQWLRPRITDKPVPDPESIRAKPNYNCRRCGDLFRANSNRQQFCKKCQPVISREQKRCRIKSYRRKVPGSPLETIQTLDTQSFKK